MSECGALTGLLYWINWLDWCSYSLVYGVNERKWKEVVVICLLLALHFSNGSPVFIEQFDLGISEEWLQHLGSVKRGN